MKKFFSILCVLLAFAGLTNAAAVVPVSGSINAGEEYSIPEGTVDEYYTTSEVIEEGKTVVVFYYNHSTDAIWGQSPIYFGPNGDNPLSRDKTLKDAAGNSVCKVVANDQKLKNASGHAVIEVYQPKEDGATWCYVICTEAEASALTVPEFGGGKVDPIDPISGSIKEKTEYTIPEGTVDEYYTTSEVIEEGKTVVVFYYNHSTDAIWGQSPIYFGPNGDNPLSRDKTLKDAAGNSVCKVVANDQKLKNASGHAVIEVYQPKEDGATWCYVICTEAEVATLAVPDFGGVTPPTPEVVPGQDVANAIVLTQGVAAEFKSTKKSVYVKFVAPNSGTITMDLSAENNYARWMEDGIMAYGQLKQNYFTNGNQFNVEKGKTYYCYYGFAEDVTGTVSYSLEVAEKGAARGEAILLEGNGQQDLLGIPHTGSGSNAEYFNKTTWYKLEKDGAFDGLDLAVVAIGGSNQTEVALYVDEETSPIKTYAMGSGSGMLPVNSTVKFDINVSEHDYYIGITQDDVNGTANFTFRTSEPGEVMSKAYTAVEGTNNVGTKTGWYKYTHTGDNKTIKISGISNVYNEDGGNVAEGEDIKVGFVIEDGTSIYFEASANFTLTLVAAEKGMTADDPVIINNEAGATFNLGNGPATDAYRYMQYAAVADGTFIYATNNAKVLQNANSATIRDITNPDAIKPVNTIQKETDEYGETYFIYKWSVIEGHTYAIEQGLGNNYGTVEFYTMFTEAAEGETPGKAIAVNLGEAKDLGRNAGTVKYYAFTAEEAGQYTLSIQLEGYVKSYDADLKGTSIPVNYSNGLKYHNETFSLAAGETLIFSCEPSATIEHIDVDIKDELISNYYAVVTKADEATGLDYSNPIAITLDKDTSLGTSNVWYGPITVPANNVLTVEVATTADVNAIYLAENTISSGLQWINTSSALTVVTAEGKQTYTLKASEAERTIQLMAYGMSCNGTFIVSVVEPIDPNAYYIIIKKGEETIQKKVTPEMKIEWKNGSDMK